jgi:predicted O-methyltransferase YrrM
MKKILALLSLFSLVFSDTIESVKYTVLDNLHEIWGWCSEEKATQFIDLVYEVQPETCVEIGVFAGASLFPVAAALKGIGKGVILAIDPWDKIECIRYLDPDLDTKDLRWWAHQNLDHIYFGYLSLIRQYELEKQVITLKLTSKKAAKIIGHIDILHIDGNHYPKAAIEDVQFYLPKVRSGGYIWFNDANWPALFPAIALLKEACDEIKSIDQGNCLLFRKR